MESYSVQAVLSAVDKGFTSTMNGAVKTLGGIQSASSASTNSILKIASGIGVFKALSAGANMLRSSISSAFARQDTMEQFNRTMTTITGNTEAASDALEDLKGITKGTAYGLDIAAKATKDFVTRGMEIKSATKSVAAWADAVAFYGQGTNEQLQSVSDAIAKMRTKGKVEMDQLNRLFDVGIDAVGMYAKAVGRDSASVQKDLSSGKISAEQFLSTVETAMMEGTNGVQKIAGAAKEAGASWQGTFDNMRAAVTRGTLSIINSIDAMLEKNGFPTMRQSVKAFGDTAETVLNKVAGLINNMTNASAALPQVGALLGGVLAAGGGLGYLDMLPDVFNVATVKAENFGKSLSNTKNKVDILSKVLRGKLDVESDAFQQMNKSSQDFVKRFDDMKTKLMDATSSITPTVQKISAKIDSMIPSGIKRKFTDFQDIASGTFIQVKNRATQFGDKVGEAFFKFGTATGRFEADAPKVWKIFNSLSDKAQKLPSVFSGIGKGLQKGASVGVTAMNNMVSALTSVMSIALRAVGPAAILGLVLVGMGVLQGQFGTQIDSFIQMAITKGPEVINAFVQGIVNQIPSLISTGSQMLVGFLNVITANLPAVVSGGVKIISSLVSGVSANIPEILPAAINVITTFITSIISALPKLLLVGMQLILSLVRGLVNNIDLLTESSNSIIESITNGIETYLPQILMYGILILTTLAQGIVQALPQLIIAAIEGITTIVNTISDNLPQILQAAVEIVSMLVKGIVSNLPQILAAAGKLLAAVAQGIISNLPQITASGLKIIITLASGIISALPKILSAGQSIIASVAQGILNGMSKAVSATKQIVTSIGNTIKGCISSAVKWGSDIVTGIANGIKGAIGKVTGAVKSVANSIKSFLHFSRPDEGPLRPYEKWMPDFMKGIAKGIKNNVGLIESAVAEVASAMDMTAAVQVTPLVNVADFSGISHQYYADAELNRDYSYSGNATYTIVVPLDVDGREFAKATATYTQEELNRMETRNNRKRGYR